MYNVHTKKWGKPFFFSMPQSKWNERNKYEKLQKWKIVIVLSLYIEHAIFL